MGEAATVDLLHERAGWARRFYDMVEEWLKRVTLFMRAFGCKALGAHQVETNHPIEQVIRDFGFLPFALVALHDTALPSESKPDILMLAKASALLVKIMTLCTDPAAAVMVMSKELPDDIHEFLELAARLDEVVTDSHGFAYNSPKVHELAWHVHAASQKRGPSPLFSTAPFETFLKVVKARGR